MPSCRSSTWKCGSRSTTNAPDLTAASGLFLGEGFNQTVPFLATFTQAVDSPHTFFPQIPNYVVTINWDTDAVEPVTGQGIVSLTKQESTPDGYKYTGRIEGIHKYEVAGLYHVEVTLDAGPGHVVSKTLDIEVFPIVGSDDLAITAVTLPNVPGMPPSIPPGFAEGSEYEISLVSPLATEYKVDWGDGFIGGTSASPDHTYVDDLFQSTYSIHGAAKIGGAWKFAFGPNVNVVDVAQTAQISGPLTAVAGETYTLQLSNSDDVVDPVVSWRVDWNSDGVTPMPEFPDDFYL